MLWRFIYFAVKCARLRDIAIYALLFVAMAAINPIFRQNGVTVLFVVGNNLITLEAILYGLVASAVTLSAIRYGIACFRIL